MPKTGFQLSSGERQQAVNGGFLTCQGRHYAIFNPKRPLRPKDSRLFPVTLL